jgi:predicted transcriptional regulator
MRRLIDQDASDVLQALAHHHDERDGPLCYLSVYAIAEDTDLDLHRVRRAIGVLEQANVISVIDGVAVWSLHFEVRP